VAFSELVCTRGVMDDLEASWRGRIAVITHRQLPVAGHADREIDARTFGIRLVRQPRHAIALHRTGFAADSLDLIDADVVPLVIAAIGALRADFRYARVARRIEHWTCITFVMRARRVGLALGAAERVDLVDARLGPVAGFLFAILVADDLYQVDAALIPRNR